jgi:homoserine kinase
MSASFTVTVPATTANLGSGFDCIGAALTLYNQFQFSNADEPLIINVSGTESDRVDRTTKNLAYQAFIKLYERLKKPTPNVQIDINLGVPLARGLGSSATAIVGGLVGANLLAGSPLNTTEIMQLAIAMEGHPDNVVPALLGGCRLAATKLPGQTGWEICDIPWHNDIIPVVAIPDFELSTSEARAVLPTNYTRADAIFNTAHLGLLLRALETGNIAWLTAALQDKIHQPYRKSLIKGYDEVYDSVINSGGYGMVISGAGPTLLALTNKDHAERVKTAIATTWQQVGINPEVRILSIDNNGAKF